jgi:hypothetical protein
LVAVEVARAAQQQREQVAVQVAAHTAVGLAVLVHPDKDLQEVTVLLLRQAAAVVRVLLVVMAQTAAQAVTVV